jgi:DNA-binding NarL/FixJ family response regulator
MSSSPLVPKRLKADVTDLLGAIDVPTLVLHSRHDQMIDFSEARIIASSIRAPAWCHSRAETTSSSPTSPPGTRSSRRLANSGRRRCPNRVGSTTTQPLSQREREVLQFAARGLDNVAIANQLTLSVRTVERHLSNAYLKLGVSGKSARAAAVAHLFTERAGR